MAVLRKHHIHSLEFNLGIAAGDMAKDLQDRIGAFAAEEAPAILEQVINNHEQPGTVTRIDRLEVDLGIVNPDSLEFDIREKLPGKLEQALAEKIKHPGPALPGQEGVQFVPFASTLLEQLEYFLLNGQLPWNADMDVFRHLDRLVTGLVKDSPAALKTLLRRAAAIETARQRLVFNLREETLVTLLETGLDLTGKDMEKIISAIKWISGRLAQSGVRVHRKLFRFDVLIAQLTGAPQLKTAVLSDDTLQNALKKTNFYRLVSYMAHEQTLLGWGRRPLFKIWLDKELQPVLFWSGEQWQAFKDSIVLPGEPPGDFPREAGDLWEILARKLETIDKPYRELTLKTDGILTKADRETKKAAAFVSGVHGEPPGAVPREPGQVPEPLPPQSRVERAFGNQGALLKNRPLDPHKTFYSPSDRHGEFDAVMEEEKETPEADELLPKAKKTGTAFTGTPGEPAEAAPPEPGQIPAAEKQIRTLPEIAEPGRETRTQPQQGAVTDNDYWFIRNSGLVVLWPYLNRYLETLNLVEKGRFISPQHQLQAIHELEFLVRGREEYMEYDLVLNKVLCGLPLTVPVDTSFAAAPLDSGEAEKLLQAAVRNWQIIANTSVKGFRNSFLKRDGKLTQQENSWTLVIDRRGYDVLLEKLPYPIHVVKLPWMEKPLFVEW